MVRAGNSNATKSGMYARDPFLILSCNKCGARDVCPRFQQDAKCWYEQNEEQPDLDTAEGILLALKRKVEADMIRFNRSIRFHTGKGNSFVDRDTTTLSSGLTRDLQVLAELSVKFGKIETDPKHDPAPTTLIRAENINILQMTSDEVEKCHQLKQQLAALELEGQSLGVKSSTS